jgi:hypothetical protein
MKKYLYLLLFVVPVLAESIPVREMTVVSTGRRDGAGPYGMNV